MGSSSSQSTNQAQSTSASSSYIPSYSEEPILENLAQYTGQLGSDVSNWANGVWGNVANLSDQAIQSYGNIANNAVTQGAGYETAANQGLGQYDNQILDANTYNSTARQQFEAGQAEAAQTQAGQQAMDAAKQNLAGYGIAADPSTGRYADLDAANRIQTAASAAGAGTQAIQNTAATGRQLTANNISAGATYGNLASGALNTGLQGVAGAANTELGAANAGANLQGVANNYMQTAMSLKYPPLGNSSASQSTSQGQSTSQAVTDPPAGSSGSGSKSPQQSSGNGGGNGNTGSPYNPSTGSTSSGGGGGGSSQWSPAPNDGSGSGTIGQPDTYAPFNDYGLSNSSSGTFGDPNWSPDTNGLGGYGATQQSWGTPGGYSPDAMNGSTGGIGSWTDSLNMGNAVDSSGSSFGSGVDSGASAVGSYGGGGGYAQGGLVGQHQVPQQQRQVSNPFNFTGGGDVTPQMSPSQGNTVDDVRANLNSGEFVIPRDVVQHKGHEFFHKLINQSRQNNMQYAAKQKMRGPR